MRSMFTAIITIAVVFFCITEARICPDGRSSCDDKATCCLIGQGIYGCCPLPNAVCCEDHLHCCPQKTRCDVETQRCLSSDGSSSEMRRKQQARRIDANAVICPDHRTRCDDDATCCDLGHGRYGCCPMPKAVCCEDHLHCCPENTECDVEHGKCIGHGKETTHWWKKQHASKLSYKKSVKTEPASKPCTDGTKCSSTNKCCENENGDSSCCPYDNGVCCEGATFCCPKGFTCDEGQCYQEDDDSIVMKIATETIPTLEDEEDDPVQCADGSECPSMNKCCQSKDGNGKTVYKCCPLSKGVCCEHACCPHGYRCVEGDKCVSNRKLLTKIHDLFNY